MGIELKVWVLNENLSNVEKPDDWLNGIFEFEVSWVLIGYLVKSSFCL